MGDAVRIFETDTYGEMSNKIFYQFEVGQNCTIKGFVYDGEMAFPKGELVIKCLEELDLHENVGTGNRRKRVKPPQSIGGFVAQKIFRWDKTTRDGKPIYSIWRMQ